MTNQQNIMFLFQFILIYLVYLPPKDRISVSVFFRRYSGFCKNVTSMLVGFTNVKQRKRSYVFIRPSKEWPCPSVRSQLLLNAIT